MGMVTPLPLEVKLQAEYRHKMAYSPSLTQPEKQERNKCQSYLIKPTSSAPN